MSGIKQARKNQDRTVVDDDEVILSEKWLVEFRDSRGFSIVRQFHAPGFYEAYDATMTYAEKLTLEILWFKEKRNCGSEYLNRNFPLLESFCTYCNKRFNHVDPLKCADFNCYSEFCSKPCAQNHQNMRHHPDRK